MTIFSKMRITHKISALMVALALGFILIGVTYYVQITYSETARAHEKQAFIYQQKSAELKQLELALGFQTTQIEALAASAAREQIDALHTRFSTALTEIRALPLAQVHNQALSQIQNELDSYRDKLNNKVEALGALHNESVEQVSKDIGLSFDNAGSLIRSAGSNELFEGFTALKFSLDNFINSPSSSNRSSTLQNMTKFNTLLEDAESSLTTEQKQQLSEQIGLAASRALNLVDELFLANQALEQQQANMETLINSLTSGASEMLQNAIDAALATDQKSQAAVTAVIFLVAMGAAIGIYFIYKSIVFPMVHIQGVIARINRGKTKARVKVMNNDELADLGRAFNKLFDERINQLETQSIENERLNNSIISLIRALGAIANKDLTVKVPVSSDITGTISDAVNLLTSETGKTLFEVKNISREVNATSNMLQDQSKLVMQFAESERMQIVATSKALRVLAAAMNEVAKQAEQADKSATRAIESTQSAKETVSKSVSGILTIRETISETEKRTKRLGERSQEISGIVNLINTIAERTHILALNASMHAASAGEAGKGFAVVAEEVQRLAESARKSTDDIAAMVNNIRVETSDTVTIMNKLISQVADESRLAEQAGREMEQTERATRDLVKTVKEIAAQAVQQAAVADRIKDRASIIKNFTDKTEKQLQEQKVFTDNLRQYAAALVAEVDQFTLPQDEAAESAQRAAHQAEAFSQAV